MKDFFLIFAGGISAGYFLLQLVQSYRLKSFKQVAAQILDKAEKDARDIKNRAQDATSQIEKRALEASLKMQNELKHKEELSIKRDKELSLRIQNLEKKEKEIRKKEETQLRIGSELESKQSQLQQELERIASLTQGQARQELIDRASSAAERECRKIFFDKLQELEAQVEQEAKKLIITAIGRCSRKQIPENSITLFPLPNNEVKAKIIGREGKNMRAFEELAGVTLFIDDTPQFILISCFDPIRRHIAKLALTDLIKDGRITPQRIEEELKKNSTLFEQSLMKIGQEAADSVRVYDLHPELLKVLGRLKFRSSLGQNVLDHSVEVSEIMGLITAELKLNESLARRIGLLHDIGKALASTNGHSHAIVGLNFALQHGESQAVANGIGCHHDEIVPSTLEASLCKPADSISAIRLGARSENSEKHHHKLTALEEIAKSFAGVENAFALQAGREIKVFVKPDLVDDIQATNLARLIATKIELTNGSSSKVQVTVIREKKAIYSGG